MKWFDGMIYRLFYWRWDKKLAKDKGLRDLFRAHLDHWEKNPPKSPVVCDNPSWSHYNKIGGKK